jgi:hypothetical protein
MGFLSSSSPDFGTSQKLFFSTLKGNKSCVGYGGQGGKINFAELVLFQRLLQPAPSKCVKLSKK